MAREIFGLPADKRLILFGAGNPFGNPRKGFDLLRTALADLDAEPAEVELVVFGSATDDAPDLGFDTTYVGYLDDDVSLALLYAAADVMVVPSRYEGFGQTISEAMACGTPVVAFDASGPRDVVDHRETGYLAESYETDDLAAGRRRAPTRYRRRDALSTAARETATERFDMEVVAEQYASLYAELVT